MSIRVYIIFNWSQKSSFPYTLSVEYLWKHFKVTTKATAYKNCTYDIADSYSVHERWRKSQWHLLKHS